jgi:hypothetical protein
VRGHGVHTDADYQNRIILQDNTLDIPVVVRQPYPDHKYAPHATVQLKAQAWHAFAVASGVVSST